MGIFEPYRAIGYITSGVPFSIQRLGTETFVTVSVGKAFQIYNVSANLSSLPLISDVEIIHLLTFSFLLQCSNLKLMLIGECVCLNLAFG